MSKLNLFTLKMKLDRHKLSYQILNENESIQLGDAKVSTKQWLSFVILPFLAGFMLLLLTVLGIIPFIRLLTIVSIGLLFSFGGIRLSQFKKKKKNNKNIKVISKGSIKIISEHNEKIYKAEDIKSIDFLVELREEGFNEGVLFLEDIDGQKHQILGIFEKDRKYLVSDLEYFKEYFLQIIKY